MCLHMKAYCYHMFYFMEITLKTFQEAFDSIDPSVQKSILLANGFSQAWDSNIFNYRNLLETANFGARSSAVREIFNRLGTYDFEKVMKRLISAEVILEVYGVDPLLLNRLKEDQEIIKSALITAISNTHPDLPRQVTDLQYVAVRTFLKRFSSVFTLNYDLLFYWARNKHKLDPEYNTDDGFRGGPWEGVESQNVHFLHGGLHLYDTVNGVKKHICSDEGDTIVMQVRNNMENKRFPIFVSEPTYQKKKIRIEHNPYLNFCYRKLGRAKGVMFIYGHSMDENDKHIFEAIKESNVNRVFVSVYGDENSEENVLLQGKATAFLSSNTTSVEFYKAETTPVWV